MLEYFKSLLHGKMWLATRVLYLNAFPLALCSHSSQSHNLFFIKIYLSFVWPHTNNKKFPKSSFRYRVCSGSSLLFWHFNSPFWFWPNHLILIISSLWFFDCINQSVSLLYQSILSTVAQIYGFWSSIWYTETWFDAICFVCFCFPMACIFISFNKFLPFKIFPIFIPGILNLLNSCS